MLSLDLGEVVTGVLSMGEESRAAWTSHPGLVVPTTELIKHDVYVQEMLDAHRRASGRTSGLTGRPVAEAGLRFRMSSEEQAILPELALENALALTLGRTTRAWRIAPIRSP